MSTPDRMDVTLSERTPVGSGGVSVLAIEGPGTLDLLASWGVTQATPGELLFRRLCIAGEELDEAMVCVHSRALAEVHVHGSPPLLKRLLVSGTRPAPAPSALEERALAALAQAPCELAARLLLDQVEGAWPREARALLALSNDQRQARLAELSRRSSLLQRAFEPTRVQIAGPVNAGKSTLFNCLLGSERAITNPEAGTTRDLIVERALFGPWPIWLLDGAGQRSGLGEDPPARVERAGQDLARRELERVDWVLWLVPPGEDFGPSAPDRSHVTELGSRSDLPGGNPGGISTLQDPEGAVNRVAQLFRRVFDLPESPREPGAAVAFDPTSRAWLERLHGEGGVWTVSELERCAEGAESQGRR